MAEPRGRKCRRCGADLWRKNGPPRPNGYQPWACAPCNIAGVRRWIQAHPAEHAATNRVAVRKFHLAKRGLTIETYDALASRQDGACAICRQPEKRRRLAVDHDHADNTVRGPLCGPCNQAIGLMRDDPSRLRAAADYLIAAKGKQVR